MSNWDKNYKVGQASLQSGAGNLLQSAAIVITKWAKYYIPEESNKHAIYKSCKSIILFI